MKPEPSLIQTNLLLLALSGCAASAPPAVESGGGEPAASAGAEPASGAETAATQAPAPDTAAHMRVSFWSAIGARDALIQGDLEGAKRFSDGLSKQDFSALPGNWKRQAGEMQKHASEAAMAGDIAEAADSVARVAVACGRCHQQQSTDGGKVLAASRPTAGTETVARRMARHEAAADDLWVGLVAPSDEAWKQGALTLRDLSPEPPTEGDQSVDTNFTAELNAIKALGLRALSAASIEERAQLYADYLERCASCHSVARR
ncbi:MAG: hypothetical protein OEZ06_08405 [Myxococcales bacterium]|nr:hypothetical protein [Myxococcales bacterium]